MEKVKDISGKCLQLIQEFECAGDASKFLSAYKDSGGIWTIGIGTTRYPDGSKVKEGDKISLPEAYECLQHDLQDAMLSVDALTTDAIEQHEFDALVSFVYNIGKTNYRNSTLRRCVNANHKNYKIIAYQMLRWKYDDGAEQQGLLRRRKAEAYLYVYGDLKYYFTNTDNIV